MWLRSPNAEAQIRLQISHGIPSVGGADDAALCRRSRAAARRCRRSFSKLLAALLIVTHQPDLSAADVSSSLG